MTRAEGYFSDEMMESVKSVEGSGELQVHRRKSKVTRVEKLSGGCLLHHINWSVASHSNSPTFPHLTPIK